VILGVTLPTAGPAAWATPTLPPGVRLESLVADGKTQAEIYKWIRSEEAGYDLGETAIRDWVQKHWHDYLRSKWLEHLQGRTFWIELKRCQFGILTQQFLEQQPLLDQIIDKLKVGQENLDVIRWAVRESHPLTTVHRILTAVDVNSCHLVHFFDPPRP
jgi:hypothetical protein